MPYTIKAETASLNRLVIYWDYKTKF